MTPIFLNSLTTHAMADQRALLVGIGLSINPFASRDFAEKRVLVF